jgi:hypothetical protein
MLVKKKKKKESITEVLISLIARQTNDRTATRHTTLACIWAALSSSSVFFLLLANAKH